MLSAFARLPDGQIETCATAERAAELSGRADVVLWVDLEQPTELELQTVERAFCLDADAVDDCVRGEQRPRIDEFADHVLIVL